MRAVHGECHASSVLDSSQMSQWRRADGGAKGPNQPLVSCNGLLMAGSFNRLGLHLDEQADSSTGKPPETMLPPTPMLCKRLKQLKHTGRLGKML